MTTREPGPGEWGGQPGQAHSLCPNAKEEAAVALLRRREPAAGVLAHLEACPPCKDECEELAALPGLLVAARETLGSASPDPPRPQLLDGLLAEVGRRRRRRLLIGLLIGLLAAATTAAAATAAVVAFSMGTRSEAPGRARQAGQAGQAALAASGTGTDAVTGANAWVGVRPEDGGSAVTVAVHGWPAGKPCRMVLYVKGGQVRDVGVWTVGSAIESTYAEDVDLPPPRIERVELVDDGTGRAMIEVPVRQA